jgi:polyisoprenyl-teichoic acid--peptidoglycan teichoic acid transferase
MTLEKRQTVPKRRIIAITAILLVAGLAFGAWYWIRCMNCDPEWLNVGLPNEPYSVLVLGTDVPYSHVAPRRQVGDKTAFTGRSDTVMLVMIDPNRRTVRGINIPRDTMAEIPGHGYQKINAANAIGGPELAAETVSKMLGITVDHFLVLNVQGLVEVVDEIGGVTVDIPKRLSYMDWTAKLKIDLEPGVHTLTGNQAMGFVRFRHDDLGDIGRIQRQQMFIRSVMAKLMNPTSWPRIPSLVAIAHRNVLSDLNDVQLFKIFNLVRAVPREQIQFAMLPGHFGPYGSWVPDQQETNKLLARMYGVPMLPEDRRNLTVTIKDVSTVPGLADKLAALLRQRGYTVVVAHRNSLEAVAGTAKTRIIAQRGNFNEAQMVMQDLGNRGEIVNASIGDIYSAITIEVANDLEALGQSSIAAGENNQHL